MDDNETLELIGFRIDPDTEEPELFTLLIYGVNDRPIQTKGRIIFFTVPNLASQALELCSDEISRKLTLVPTEVEMIVDIAETLYLVQSQNIDTMATILNCLNMLIDLVRATGKSCPEHYRQLLYDFADHLTFEQEFAGFLDERNISRSLILDAILWCLGAVLAKSKILRTSSL